MGGGGGGGGGAGLELTVIITVHLIQVLVRAIASTPGPGYHYPGVTSAWQVCMANTIWSHPLFAMQKLIESIGSVREKVKYPA